MSVCLDPSARSKPATATAVPISSLRTEKQEAARLGFSVRTLQQWRLRGGGPPYLKIGSAVRYNPDAVDAWLNERTRHSTAQSAV
jgi:predicted DNA-binding transcriptional regulator AlpA